MSAHYLAALYAPRRRDDVFQNAACITAQPRDVVLGGLRWA
jgi:hypothetical protein